MRLAIAVFLINASFLSAQNATIKIDTSRVENAVSPRMYAAFAEMMAEGVKRGITAEMLSDRSFEESPSYLGLPLSWRVEPDERNVPNIKFEQTTQQAYPMLNRATGVPEHSLLVTLTPDDYTDSRRGLSQGSVSISRGQTYKGYFWAKVPDENGYKGDITVALEEDHSDGEVYAKESLPMSVNSDWQRYTFSLSPTKTDRFAKLSFCFHGSGSLYIDQASLEPADATGEIRSDSLRKIAELRPSFIRWPGGNVAQEYDWRWGIGPRDLRPIWANRAWSNAPEPMDLGTDEYLALCARLGAEPSITVNVGGAGATPLEAAEWVEYVNGSIDSKYGAMRAANGHPKPYGVRQWELGNEIDGDWERGHVDAQTYANEVLEYAKAMRAVDPSIQLIAVGEGLGKSADNWNTTILRAAGPLIDFLAVHDYTSKSLDATASDPRAQLMMRPGRVEANSRHIAELILKLVPTHTVKLLENEWNIFYSADVIESMEGAVYASRMMNGFERAGNVVEANCISDLLNGWVGGVIQVSRDRLYGTAQFYAIKLYNDHLGTERLSAQVSSPEVAPGFKSFDAAVTRSTDGASVFVKMSNADKQHPVRADIDLGSFAYAREVNASILSTSDPMLRNTFAHPDVVKPVEKTLQCSGPCTFLLPADSVVVLTFHKDVGPGRAL